MIDDNIE
ncbi:Hypothetical protein SSCIU_00218 [Mammaliicoccus sciuri]|nr:Hypothetical protein SSCIU_00218 [Mammaliicoccus sciuri]